MFSKTSAIVEQLIQKYEDRLGVSLEAPKTNPSNPPLPAPVQPAPPSTESKAPQPESKPIPQPPAEESKSHHEESKEPSVDLSKAPYDLFAQVDIRVGNITECWKHPQSENLYCEKIDIGEASVREIGSGLQKHIPIADMSGLVLVMANLKPRKLAGFNSNGMVMALHAGAGLELVRPLGSQVGERVGLEGVLDPPGKTAILPHMNPKKKVFENSAGFFATDSEGYACFGQKRLVTSTGYIKTAHANSKIS